MIKNQLSDQGKPEACGHRHLMGPGSCPKWAGTLEPLCCVVVLQKKCLKRGQKRMNPSQQL